MNPSSYAVSVFVLLPQWLNGRLLEMSQTNKPMWEQVVNTVVYGYKQNIPPGEVAESIKANWW